MSDLLPAVPGDVHYEVALDQPPGTAVAVPVGEVDTGAGDEWLPVRPAWASRDAARHYRRLAVRGAKSHAWRTPEYAVKTAFWAPVGAFKIGNRLRKWGFVTEQERLRNELAAAGDRHGYLAVHKDGKATRKFRGTVIAIVFGVLAVTVAAACFSGYAWALVLVLLAGLPLLARHGRPADRPIIRPVTVTPRFRLINADVVLRAYYAAGLGHPEKPDQQVTFGSTMQRDGEGSRVLVDLPYGRGLDDAMKAKPSIASGLDVQVSQVFLHRDPTSHRRHTLWVADRDPLAVPVGRTPLLACRQTDIWKPAPLGLDERGQVVKLNLMWQSVLVGALPRMGKSWTARLLALYAALDPYVQLDVFDAAGKPDWRKFSLVARSCAFGITPVREGRPPEILLATLEDIKADVQDRYNRLSELPTSVCPEGKLTREIARDPRYRMPVRLLFLDEFQEYYELDEISRPIAEGLRFVAKVAPAAGVIPVWATQKPAGIGGTGALGTMFNSTRDNFQVRLGLRTASYTVSDAVLGQGAYSMGLDSSTLLPEYKGVAILHGATDKSPTVRCYSANDQDAERILTAARALRERAGTLTGAALGEDAGPAVRDVLADVLAVFTGETGLQWGELAERLAQRFPDRWTGVTADAISAQVRGLRVPGAQVWARGSNQQGCKRMDVEQAAGPR